MCGTALTTIVFELIRTLCPSGEARMASRVPSMLAAPGLFSMTTGCPQIPDIFCPSRRATTSTPPPGGNPTMIRTGEDGYGPRCATDGGMETTETAASTAIEKMRIPAVLLTTTERNDTPLSRAARDHSAIDHENVVE